MNKRGAVVAMLVIVGCAGSEDEESVVGQQAQTKLSPPTVTIVGTTSTSIQVQVCAGPTGAKAGFTLQWISNAGLATGGWDANPERCDGSFSGNAQASSFALVPFQCTTVELGTNHVDAPGMALSCGEVDCRQQFALRAFAHAYSSGGGNVFQRSDYTVDVPAATQRCARGLRGGRIARDVGFALGKLREADADDVDDDGVPHFLRGDLGQVGPIIDDDPVLADQALRPGLPDAIAPFRLHANELALRKMHRDDDGTSHFRYHQQHNGLDVVGGDLVVTVDPKGTITSVNGDARGDFPPGLGGNAVGEASAALAVDGDPRFTGMSQSSARTVYLKTADGDMYQAYEIEAEGARGDEPVRDRVYVDVDTGAIVAVYPQIQFAENRAVFDLAHGTGLPGTLKRSEGQAANADVDINAAYDGTGAAYELYHYLFGRDSYDNAGAQLKSSVHYSTNYCNAYWNSTQMVYGDGDASQGCYPLARAVDVTAHELTHAVTENESGLTYSGESGAINESMSDIFGEVAEAYDDGGRTGTFLVSGDTWIVGEDVLPPGLRWMCDPAKDGASADIWSSTVGNLDVHYSSGVSNLMFCLLSQGGKHPRNKTTVTVGGIGIEKAARIEYKAQTDYLTASSNFLAYRNAMLEAAGALYGNASAEYQSVKDAFAAVNVGSSTNPPPPPPGITTLQIGVPIANLSDSVNGGTRMFAVTVPSGTTSLTVKISGGTGDADLYVKAITQPTVTSYDCRPYISGNSEICTFTNPVAGTYYVMLRAYAVYSGVTLLATSSAVPPGDPFLTNGVPVTGLTGASGSNKYYRLNVAAGKLVTIRISGGSGDADLYTRFGSRPTTTTWSCRPYVNGNSETCSTIATATGDWYIMLRGYTSYSGVTLVGSY